MEDDKDPFSEDKNSDEIDTHSANCGSADAKNDIRENQTSPILNSTSSNASSHAGRRKGKIRRSGLFQGAHSSTSTDTTSENLKILPSSFLEGLTLSQEFQSNFIVPKTPVRVRVEANSPEPCTSDAQSDEDMFASPAGDEQLNPSALNALLDRPEPAELSWSMITPSADQACNVSWSNLNTEERKVLLPSDGGSSLVVKPRALFSPGANDSADSYSMNISSDAEFLHDLKGQRAHTTPNFRGRKNSLVSAVPIDSPLATCIVAEDSFYDSPAHNVRKKCLEASTGSPILSGSNEFSKSIRHDNDDEEDLFGNEEDCLGILAHEPQDPKIAGSTPHAGYRKIIDSEIKHAVTPLQKENGESFLQDISVTALEEVCQAQELKDQALLSTPEKQSDSKRKRLLFSSNISGPNEIKGTFKAPEAKCNEKEKDCVQENDSNHCIPDDSFMEHLASMNTSIFSDNVQPVTKVQSIKTSLSKIKKFSYSTGEADHNADKTFTTSEPKTLMKEILSSVNVMETAPVFKGKTKLIKSNGDLVVFSQMQLEVNENLQENTMKICQDSNNPSLPVPRRPASREGEPLSTSAATPSSLLSPCEGFQTGRGKKVDLSKEALSKGLSLLKDCMEVVDVKKPTTEIAHHEVLPSPVSAAPEAKTLEMKHSDDVAAEEIKQLLQLVSDGEDFNLWHDSEVSPKPSKQETRISHTSQECRTSLVNEDKIDANSLAGGFSTAGGKSIYISDENLARAEKLLFEPEPATTNSDENLQTFNKTAEEDKNNSNLNERGRNYKQKNDTQSASDISGLVNRKRPLGEASNAKNVVVPKKKTCLEIPKAIPPFHLSAMSRNDLQEGVPCVGEAKTETNRKPLVNISEEAMNVVNSLIFSSSSKRKEAPTSRRSQVGFSTASGGTVNISKEALDKAKNLFTDLSSDIEVESSEKISNKDTLISSASEYGETRQQKETSLAKNNSNCAEQAVTTHVGFSTAGGKKVNVTEKAMAQVKNLFDDLAEPDSKLESKPCIPVPRKSLGSFSKLGLQQTGKPQTPVSNNTDCRLENGSYSTPSEKPIVQKVRRSLGSGSKLGMKSLSKAQSSVPGNINSRVTNGSLEKASGQSMSVSKERTNMVKHNLDDSPKDFCLPTVSSTCGEKSTSEDMTGFSTAGGKAVQISAEALKKASNLFDDLPTDSSRRDDKPATSTKPSGDMAGFSTAGGRVSKEALNRAQNLFDDLPSDSSDTGEKSSLTKKPSVNMAGFSTAGGRAVQISKEALNKARNLFDDVPSESTSTVAKIDPPTMPSVDMAGFSTAGGRAVQISKEALNKARNLFDDLPLESASTDAKSGSATKPSVDMAGFSTAGGRAVQISKEALNKARNLFDDLPSESTSTAAKINPPTKPSVDMAGFSTAGGRAVQISKEALNKARNLFDDLPSESASTDAKSGPSTKPAVDMAGFSTAGGRAVTISEAALNRARNLFDDPSSSIVNGNLENDSGIFLSCNDSHADSIRPRKNFTTNQSSFASSAKPLTDAEKSSLTQEITESTAAFLADDGFDLTRSSENYFFRQTISTSPSMVTDRSGGLKPVLSSASQDKSNPSQPTSPILSKSSNAASRKRPRRGRLSLATNVGSRDPPASECQSTSLPDHHRKARLSLPSTVSLSDLAPSHTDSFHEDILKRSNTDEVASEANNALNSKLPPSRKLFDTEGMDQSPAKLITPNPKQTLHVTPAAQSNPSTDVTPVLPVSKPSHQNPLIRKALAKNLTPQSSSFKTPYKTSSKDQPKRSSSSPLQNPPEAKRMKTSTNLYVSHVYLSSPGSEASNSRDLRPEVAEMRRRVTLEQKQVVENYAEHKGELLRPCLGSWLAQKLSAKSSGDLLEISAMGTPASCSPSELLKNGVRSSSLSITAENAENFRFSAWEYYSEDVCRENVAGIPAGDGARLVLDSQGFIGIEEFQRAFLASPGVDPSIVPSGWIKNHYRWLVWKLAALECHFPCQLGGRCFSPHVLMLQLKYRYDREIDRCERPALRRIFEHDDSAAKRMVLCVASIFQRDDASIGIELELTDGWYSVITSIDQDMQFRVKKGTIKIGTKLIMHNAELINCSEGCFPLQARDDIRLKLCSNSTRRARWYAKLGFQDNPGPIKVPLNSILSSGGLVSCVTAYVARVYPIVFMEKTTERTVVRSQRAESKEVARRERTREQLADKVYSQVQAELQQEQTKHKSSAKKFALKQVATIMSGEELCNILENASDPISIQSILTEEQKSIVANYQRSKQDELRSELEARVRLRLSDNANHQRQVTPILKVRLFDDVNGNHCGAILSVWRPSEDMTAMFKEGQKVSIFSAVANGVRCGDLQLSANRSTRYNCDNSAETNPKLTRCVSPLASLSLQGFLPSFGEIDIVGIVIRISAAPQTSENPSHFQTAYLSDSQQNIVGIMFWGGMKEFGMDDLIVLRSFIAASNLQCRGSPIVKAVPCVYASELSFFTTNPRQQYLQTAQQELRRSVPADLKTFCQACEDKLDDLLSQKMPPAAYLKTPPSVTKPVEEQDVKLRVQYETSPCINPAASVTAQRKLSMEEQLNTPTNTRSPALEKKLASLERYGDAVPISPIFISQPRRSLRQDFKVPRRTDSPSIECKKDD